MDALCLEFHVDVVTDTYAAKPLVLDSLGEVIWNHPRLQVKFKDIGL